MVKGPAEKFERDISILRRAVGFDQFFFLLHNFFCNFWYYNIARVWILFLCLSFFPFCSTTENVPGFTKSALDSDTSWKCKIISIDEGGRLWDSHACLLIGDDEHMSTSNFQGIKACLYVSAIDSEWSQMRCRIFSFFFFFAITDLWNLKWPLERDDFSGLSAGVLAVIALIDTWSVPRSVFTCLRVFSHVDPRQGYIYSHKIFKTIVRTESYWSSPRFPHL